MEVVYFWAGLGLLLMAAETFAPGAFLLWFGFAALALAGVVFLFPGITPLWQAVLFSVLSLLSLFVYRRWFRGSGPRSEQPLLNRKGAQMVGRTFVLDQPIVDGFGKIRVNDALWTVAGEAMPAGARVTVVDVDGLTLRVRSAD